VRGGFFQVSSAPNSDVLNFRTGGTVIEFEERHTIFDQPGKLRLGAFVNAANTGNYRQALAIAAADPTLDINDVMTSIRRTNRKYGYFANLEQQLVTDVGLFARQLERRSERNPVVQRDNEIASLGRQMRRENDGACRQTRGGAKSRRRAV
jgi:Carbohydrate-selective porin, OprB family